ncbi:hypothetical protein [Nocardioides alcanivorans]|uniref:hypothetical protein n=1 Tax=Nocardioides alcanivorans TaxID=2897352 RepID=UPI001F20C722|nr:hypothetical protein [Nocardioides alcanivorans]
MLDRSVRPLLVMGVVLGSALPGFVASASAAPVALEGGCWSYVPAAGTDLDDATGGIDAADPQIPWGSENLLDLTTSGATSVGGQRTFALAMTLPTGLEEADSATYWFDLVGADQVRTELPPVSVDLTAEDATESLPEVSVEGAVELAAPGGTTLVLRNVVFTVADLDQRVVCNGQTNPEASDVGGSNPATDPLDTNVTAAFDVAPAPSVAIDSVQGQDVRYAARAGDAVSISWSGLASDGAVSAAVCDAATCEPVSTPTSSADGAGQATLPVIASVVPGGGTVAVKDELGNEAVAPLRLLGAPTLSLRDNAKATRLRFAGADWDPTRHVRVRAFDDNGKQVGQRRLRAGGLGRVAGVVKVKKGIEVSELRAQQARAGGALEAAIDVDLGGTAPPARRVVMTRARAAPPAPTPLPAAARRRRRRRRHPWRPRRRSTCRSTRSRLPVQTCLRPRATWPSPRPSFVGPPASRISSVLRRSGSCA